VELIDRYRGALLGLAAGDALGTTLEFRPPGTFEPIDDMVGGGPFGLAAGAWTDDTSMALCLAESLVERQGFDPIDQLEQYVRWWRHGHLSSTGGCFDIGNTIRQALARFERTREPYCGSTDPAAAGNGSIMRLAPVVLAYARRPDEAVAMAAASSRTTHGAVEAVDACRLLAALLVGALRGADKADVLGSATALAGDSFSPAIRAVADGSFRHREPPAIRGTGYVVQSLEAALWAFHRGHSFEEGALLAVNLGDDADTTGAVYGQLAGAYYGDGAIPPAWRAKLVRRELIESMAERLLALSERSVLEGSRRA
jgi:ADP-ribosylglycohydrolase